MKVVFCLLVAVCAVAYARPGEHYDTKYDNVNLDDIIKSDRLLRSYVDCLLGKKKCTNDGQTLKEIIPDALKTQCSKCNETQQRGARKMLHYLIEKKRSWYNELEAVYDPDGSYRKEYDEFAKKEGFKL